MVYLVTNQKSLWDNLGPGVTFGTVGQLKEYLAQTPIIAVDTETQGFDPYTCKILSAQFGDDKKQFVVDTLTVPLTLFKEELEAPDKLWIFQNAKFDLKFFYHQKIVFKNIYDTYLAEAVLTTGNKTARKSLDYLTYKYLKIKLDKTIRGEIHKEGLSLRVIKYAAEDVAYLAQIKLFQEERILSENLQKAIQLDNLYVKVLAYIEYSGMKLDPEKWTIKMQEDEERLAVARDDLNNWVISNNYKDFIEAQLDLFSEGTVCKINWSSSKQVVEFFKTLGINTKVKNDKGGFKDSVEAKVLTPQKNDFPVISLYLEYKTAEKVCTTYGESFLKQINPISRRIHTQFTQIMDTGRLSSGGKNRATKEEYINFQNIPSIPEKEEDRVKTYYERECFTPTPGNTFVVADYSGQEQLVLANQALDKDILEFYDAGSGDMHAFVASKIYAEELKGISLSDIKKLHKDKRQIAKSAGFAINYGGTGITISQNLSIPIEQGEAVYNAYFKAFPGLNNFFNKAKRAALSNGYVFFNNVTGRKSYIDFFEDYKKLNSVVNEEDYWKRYREEKSNDSEYFNNEMKPLVREYFKLKGMIERKALNYPIQGTSADITKLAGVYLFNYLVENNLLFKVLLPNVIHDEIIVECPIEIAEDLAKVVKDCMERAGARFYTRVPLKADPHIGNSWTH